MSDEGVRARATVDPQPAKLDAYDERNRLVAAFARVALMLGWRAGVGEHQDEPGRSWEPDWRTLVVVETPEGQASWHLHDSERHLVEALPRIDAAWDGHSTPEKYERLERLARSPVALVPPLTPVARPRVGGGGEVPPEVVPKTRAALMLARDRLREAIHALDAAGVLDEDDRLPRSALEADLERAFQQVDLARSGLTNLCLEIVRSDARRGRGP